MRAARVAAVVHPEQDRDGGTEDESQQRDPAAAARGGDLCAVRHPRMMDRYGSERKDPEDPGRHTNRAL